jgi:hypothetical protein
MLIVFEYTKARSSLQMRFGTLAFAGFFKASLCSLCLFQCQTLARFALIRMAAPGQGSG